MQMDIRDVKPLWVDPVDKSLHVGASPGTVGMTWPPSLTYGDDLYSYKCNEVLTEDLLKHFGGHAKYIHIEGTL
jgi:hypothetical protein